MISSYDKNKNVIAMKYLKDPKNFSIDELTENNEKNCIRKNKNTMKSVYWAVNKGVYMVHI